MLYIRMMRLQDQYLPFFAVFIISLYLHFDKQFSIYWATALFFLSITIFMVNEMIDKKDTDQYSWNPVHVREDANINMGIFWLLFITLLIIGLGISYLINMAYWGLTIFIIGIFYSLPPIRLKNRFLLDIIGQLSVWWVLPIVAVLWKANESFSDNALLLLSSSSLIWCCFFPYQLSDFIADKKAKIRGTHIRLGMYWSLIFGMSLGIAGLILLTLDLSLIDFFVGKLGILIAIYALYNYSAWIKQDSLKKQVGNMQKYVNIVKPFSQTITILLGIILLFQ